MTPLLKPCSHLSRAASHSWLNMAGNAFHPVRSTPVMLDGLIASTFAVLLGFLHIPLLPYRCSNFPLAVLHWLCDAGAL